MLFNKIMARRQAGKQIRFPRKCETSFVGDAVYSQFTHNARYSRFPLKFDYLQTIPMLLDTSQFRMQFHLSHTSQAKGRWFWNRENSLVQMVIVLA